LCLPRLESRLIKGWSYHESEPVIEVGSLDRSGEGRRLRVSEEKSYAM
jgi:hypothetical protein